MPSKHCLDSISKKLFSDPRLTSGFLSQWSPSVLVRLKMLWFHPLFSFSSSEWGQRPCRDPKPSLQMTLHPHDHEQCTDSLGFLLEMQWFIEWCSCLGVKLLKKGWWREKNRTFMTYRQTSTHFWWGKCERKHFLVQICLQQASFRKDLYEHNFRKSREHVERSVKTHWKREG